jgi:hypothetical protein
MTVLRRAAGIFAIGVAALCSSAVAQAASGTFYVNGATGNDANPCTAPAAACKTIQAAIAKAEATAEDETARIEVAAGVYTELVNLKAPAATGITINGAGSGVGGTEIEGPEKVSQPTVELAIPGGTLALSNLSVVNDKNEDAGKGIRIFSNATLTNVVVTMEQAVNANGIEAGSIGSLTMHGGGVTMDAGTEGFAIADAIAPLSIDGATVLVASGSLAGGIAAEVSPTTLTGMVVNVASTSERPAIVSQLASLSLSGITISDNSATPGGSVALEAGLAMPLTATAVNVQMTNSASKGVGVELSLGSARFERLTVGGAWKGVAFGSEGGNITLADSTLGTGPGSTAPAVAYFAGSEVPGLVLQRSVVRANPTAVPAAMIAGNANVTLDSSELLGGQTGVVIEQGGGKTKTLTVAGSTIDAASPGVADGGSVRDLVVAAKTGNSVIDAAVEGSILLESQTSAAIGAGDHAHIVCSNSDVPSQSQAEGGANGSIECAAGASGNTHSEVASLFAAPVTEYRLSAASSAVDSVPAGAVSLPFGLTPSTTDLAGNPRVLDGNGDCLAVQDRGALELQGHAASCPPAPPPASPAGAGATTRPAAPAISALAISPGSFRAAPSGATLSASSRFGTKVSYRDSQAATATFTVLRSSGGRLQGKSCRKPSRNNRHGRRCTLLTAVGSFTHADLAGANSVHFSGRVKSRRLTPGAYVLQVLAANATGRGKPVAKGFAVRR